MPAFNEEIDCVVLIAHMHSKWDIVGFKNPLFVCSEMFFDLCNIEERRWILWRIISDIRKSIFTVQTLSDYLLPDDFSKIEQNANLISRQWYKDCDEDRSEYLGVSTGKCFEYAIQTSIMRRLKFAQSIKRLLETYPNVPLYCDYAHDSEEMSILTSFGRNVFAFDQKQYTAGIQSMKSKRIANNASKYIRQASNYALRLLTLSNRHRYNQELPTIITFPTSNILKSLEMWKSKYNNKLNIVLPSITFKNIFAMLCLIRAGANLIINDNMAANVNNQPTNDVKKELYRHIKLDGTDKQFAYLISNIETILVRVIDNLLETEYGRLIVSINKIYAMLENVRPTAVVLPNDNQTLFRAWALVAKKLNIISVTPQHGHPMFLGDGNHLTSDYSIFWSKLSAQSYIQLGLDPACALISKYPFSLTSKPSSKRNYLNLDEELIILIITTGNPGVQVKIAETWVCDYIINVLNTLTQSGLKLKLCVKLHPGESKQMYYNNIDSKLISKIKIYENADLSNLINKVDVIISPPSTCILQALLMKKPVILVSAETADNDQLSLSKLRNVLTANSYDEIINCIHKIYDNGYSVNSSGIDVSKYSGTQDSQSENNFLELLYEIVYSTRNLSNSSKDGLRDEFL